MTKKKESKALAPKPIDKDGALKKAEKQVKELQERIQMYENIHTELHSKAREMRKERNAARTLIVGLYGQIRSLELELSEFTGEFDEDYFDE